MTTWPRMFQIPAVPEPSDGDERLVLSGGEDARPVYVGSIYRPVAIERDVDLAIRKQQVLGSNPSVGSTPQAWTAPALARATDWR